jgi:hypothetical protein
MTHHAYPLVALLVLCGCERQTTELERQWEGATILRVCRDGTHIFRLRDGTARNGWNRLVENPDTVCG